MAEDNGEEKGDGCYTVIMADDGSLPVKTDHEKQAMLKERKLFEMDSYYRYIEQHTYKTEFVPVSFEQAKALKSYFRGINADENEHFVKLKQDMNEAIDRLKQAIGTNEQNEHRFFIRMSSRSPKDACGM